MTLANPYSKRGCLRFRRPLWGLPLSSSFIYAPVFLYSSPVKSLFFRTLSKRLSMCLVFVLFLRPTCPRILFLHPSLSLCTAFTPTANTVSKVGTRAVSPPYPHCCCCCCCKRCDRRAERCFAAAAALIWLRAGWKEEDGEFVGVVE